MLKETSFKVILQNGDWLGKLRVRSIITIFLISKFSCALSLLFVVGFIFNHRHSGPSLFSCKSMRTSGKIHPIVQIINTLHIKQAWWGVQAPRGTARAPPRWLGPGRTWKTEKAGKAWVQYSHTWWSSRVLADLAATSKVSDAMIRKGVFAAQGAYSWTRGLATVSPRVWAR